MAAERDPFVDELKSRLRDTRTQIAILAILFVSAYYIPIKSMMTIWWNDADYSYAFLVPAASAYLLWEKRKVLGGLPVRSAWAVLPVLVLFVLFSIYGILGSSGNASMPSVPVLIILFAAFCYGMESAKRLLLPLGFLIFMVPMPPTVERTIGLWLKNVSTRLGGAFIGLFDIPVHVSGNVIDLGVTQLQVVDACSGLRYIFPLMALGTLYAYFFERAAWRRLFCAVATIPIGVLINALRIGITGMLTEIFGPKVSEGFFHAFQGWVLFVFALALLFVLSRILSLFSHGGHPRMDRAAPKPSPASVPAAGGKAPAGAFLLSAALLLLVLGLSLSTTTMPAMALDGGIQSFPLHIGQWNGKKEVIDPEMVRESGAEEAFSGDFADASGHEISLYLGYRGTAFLADENFFHSPTVCIPSQGWVEDEVKRGTVAGVPHFGNLDVTKMVVEKDGIKQLVYFWFQTKDEATCDKDINRFHLSLHAIRRDNTYDLFIRPVTMIAPGETISDAGTRLDGFVRQMMPVLIRFLKDKQAKGPGSKV